MTEPAKTSSVFNWRSEAGDLLDHDILFVSQSVLASGLGDWFADTCVRPWVGEIATSDRPDRFLTLMKAIVVLAASEAPLLWPNAQPHGLSGAPPENPLYRRCVRVLSMVHELHKAGYQRLRILPMMSPSGVHWRGVITFADNVATDGYRILREEDDLVARYTSGQDNEYFGWKDATHASARELADLFLQRFPEIARKGEGLDWAYAGWLTDVLGYAELGEGKGGLVHLIQDWENDPAYMARWTPPPPRQ
jgi:hypothetical protein